MSDVAVAAVVDQGLGNSAYLVDLGDGRALAVDPPRDLRALRRQADRTGVTVAFAADTHLHADFLSGVRQLAAESGAEIVAPARGHRLFEHRGLDDGDEVDLGGLRMRALATSGHTHEHLAYLLLDGTTPVGVFTGGSLIIGGAARTDLLGEDLAEPLARAQYHSLRRLTALPDATAVWPTHGAGSFCSAPTTGQRTSTIGVERATNPLLALPGEDAFVAKLLGGLGTYPAYFRWLAEANRRGADIGTGEPALPPLDATQVRRLLDDGAVIVDVRPIGDFAAGHLPDAVSIQLRAQFATWLGWLLPPHTPIVIVRNSNQKPTDILWPALNIGYEGILGELAGGAAAWAAAGEQLRQVPLVRPDRLTGRVLDVRQDAEYAAGHVPGAAHVELGDLAKAASSADVQPTVVMCEHGQRAMTGASLLARAGHRNLSVLLGGLDGWAAAIGQRPAYGLP